MGSNDNILIGLVIGTAAYIVLYIGKVIQKYAIEGYKGDKEVKKNTSVWIIGTILTASYMFIQWAALLFAPINLIAPLEGVGLITLIILSYYILKEDITRFEIFGIVFIIIGTVFITLFNVNTGYIYLWDFSIDKFLWFSIPILIIEGIAILGSILSGYKAAGLIIGTTAGTFMALQTVTKRITALPDPTLTFWFSIYVMLFAILTLAGTQFAFVKAKANQVLPCFTSASIVLATFAGFISLNERIELMQIFGIITVIVGIVFLTAFRKEGD